MKDNMKAFMAMEKDLEKKYPHKIVTMCNGDVVSVADAYMGAIKEAREKFRVTKLFIHRLGPSKDTVAVL